MQFDNFAQLYRDTDIFEPWENRLKRRPIILIFTLKTYPAKPRMTVKENKIANA